MIIAWSHWLQNWFVSDANNYLSNSSKLTYRSHRVRTFQKYLSPDPILTTVYFCLSNLVLFQHMVAYITTLLSFYSLPLPSTQRGVRWHRENTGKCRSCTLASTFKGSASSSWFVLGRGTLVTVLVTHAPTSLHIGQGHTNILLFQGLR